MSGLWQQEESYFCLLPVEECLVSLSNTTAFLRFSLTVKYFISQSPASAPYWVPEKWQIQLGMVMYGGRFQLCHSHGMEESAGVHDHI